MARIDISIKDEIVLSDNSSDIIVDIVAYVNTEMVDCSNVKVKRRNNAIFIDKHCLKSQIQNDSLRKAVELKIKETCRH